MHVIQSKAEESLLRSYEFVGRVILVGVGIALLSASMFGGGEFSDFLRDVLRAFGG